MQVKHERNRKITFNELVWERVMMFINKQSKWTRYKSVHSLTTLIQLLNFQYFLVLILQCVILNFITQSQTINRNTVWKISADQQAKGEFVYNTSRSEEDCIKNNHFRYILFLLTSSSKERKAINPSTRWDAGTRTWSYIFSFLILHNIVN